MVKSCKKNKYRMHEVVIQVWIYKEIELKSGKVVIVPDGYSVHRSFRDAYHFRAYNANLSCLYFSGAPYRAMVGDKKWDELLKFGNLYFSKKPPSRRRCRRPRI